MAVKNHALDEKIVEAARAEFLEKGFRGASLQKIAARAGLTTGALYTRYKGKDDLFRSLVQDVLDEAASISQSLAPLYYEARDSRDPAQILRVIREEEAFYQKLLFSHAEQCTLLFCRSDGSALGESIRRMMAEKAQGTADYLQSISDSPLDLDGVGILLSSQFE